MTNEKLAQAKRLQETVETLKAGLARFSEIKAHKDSNRLFTGLQYVERFIDRETIAVLWDLVESKASHELATLQKQFEQL